MGDVVRVLYRLDGPHPLGEVLDVLKRSPLRLQFVAAADREDFCSKLRAGEFDMVLGDQRAAPSVEGVGAPCRQEWFASLLELSGAFFAVVDAEGRVLFSSGGDEPWLGRRSEETLGQSGFRHIHPDDLAQVAARFAELVEQPGGVATAEFRARHKDGSWRWLAVTAANHLNNPAIGGIVITTQDTTDLRRAEQDRKQIEEQLHRREAEMAHLGRVHTIGQLTAALAHEINQPLHAINNYVRGIQRRLKTGQRADGAAMAEAMDKVSAEVVRASGIIAHLREFMRRSEPLRSRVDVADLLRRAIGLMEARFRDKSIDVELRVEPELPPLCCDAIQMEQVVVNLLQNAVEASSGVPRKRRQLTVAARRDAEGGIELSVADQGTGIPPEAAVRLFEPFNTTKPHGLGMGLAICRSIVELHRGRISAEPNQPCGAVVRFVLPSARVE